MNAKYIEILHCLSIYTRFSMNHFYFMFCYLRKPTEVVEIYLIKMSVTVVVVLVVAVFNATGFKPSQINLKKIIYFSLERYFFQVLLLVMARTFGALLLYKYLYVISRESFLFHACLLDLQKPSVVVAVAVKSSMQPVPRH